MTSLTLFSRLSPPYTSRTHTRMSCAEEREQALVRILNGTNSWVPRYTPECCHHNTNQNLSANSIITEHSLTDSSDPPSPRRRRARAPVEFSRRHSNKPGRTKDKRTESSLFLKLCPLEMFAKYSFGCPNRSFLESTSCTCAPVPSENLPTSLRKGNSQLRRNEEWCHHSLSYRKPVAKSEAVKPEQLANASMNLSCDSLLEEENEMYGAESFLEMAPMKKRIRARWAGSFGSRPESGYKSAESSMNTSDSTIFSDSEDGG